MKKTICTLLSATLVLGLLTACQAIAVPRPSGAQKLLEFPKTNWDMSLWEVMQAYDIAADTAGVTVLDDESAFSVDGLEFFGQKTSNVIFSFQSGADDKACLAKVQLNYPDDADMQLVRKHLQNAYGSSMKRYMVLSQSGSHYMARVQEETEHYAFWHNSLRISEYLNEEDLAVFQRLAEDKDEELEAAGAWIAYVQNAPLVVLTWEDDAKLPDNLAGISGSIAVAKNQVVFNASVLHALPRLCQNAA